jgi:hypothetical protein
MYSRGYDTTLDFIDKGKTFARLCRLDTQPAITVLTTTTRLTNKLALAFDRLGNRFAVGNLRRTDIGTRP